jgi:glucose/arabinose dehydrogenase
LLSICVAMVLAIAVDAFAQLHTVPYVSGLSHPVEFVQDPTSPSIQFVVEQAGRIRVIQNGMLLPTPFLDVSGAISSGGERGLLGLAFSPDYAASRRFFVNFTDLNGNTVVARFKRSVGNPLVADPATRFDLRWDGGERFIAQPFANHNGGHLAFGPDGFLYVGMGDGGSGGDPLNNAQRPDTLLGKILRINVLVSDQDPEGYAVPSDNPFVDDVPIQALPEIWAFGVRNPWKFSFDDLALGGTGAMLIGDVGQNAYEEVDYQPPNAGGRNYGWRVFEGAHPYDSSLGPAYLPLVGPIAEYDHTVGNSITGGFVYRGSSLGAFYRGRYFYADFVAARVWSIALNPAGNGGVTASAPIEHTAELGGFGAIGNVSAFGVDAAGELYIVSYSSGQILKVTLKVTHTAFVPEDLNYDGAADLGLFRPSTGTWLTRYGSAGFASGADFSFGQAGDIPVPGDYDGDGRLDLALYRPAAGTWYILYSSNGAFVQLNWGNGTDVPVPADYTGDGRTEIAVWRPATGEWFIIDLATGAYYNYQWGLPGDVPLTADFDGDGKADITVFRPANGYWYVYQSTTRTVAVYQWGGNGDIPVPADYSGDGRPELAVYRPSNGNWFVYNLSTGAYGNYSWGVAGDVPAPRDADGDGRVDLVVWRPSSAQWFLYYLGSNTYQVVTYGASSDQVIR